MFKRLREKWNVTPKQFWIIFIAFGCTGLTSAFIFKFVSGWIGLSSDTFWLYRWTIKLVFMVVGYQILLLIYGGIFGQWDFFWAYEQRFLRRLGLIKAKVASPIEYQQKKSDEHSIKQFSYPEEEKSFNYTIIETTDDVRIAIFASGAGSNAKKIIEYFANHSKIQVALIASNKENVGVLTIAKSNNIETLIIKKDLFYNGEGYIEFLKKRNINFIVLAGFLWKIPETLINAYPTSIVNIHPALLPSYGGKGMYGSKVHEAVIIKGDKQSGITIHFVDANYDEGDIIFQEKCMVDLNETPDSLAEKIHQLEHQHYPKVIEQIILDKISKF